MSKKQKVESKAIKNISMMRYKLTPAKEVAIDTTLGIELINACNHDKIPGLDADFCEKCRIYFIDQSERNRYYAKKW